MATIVDSLLVTLGLDAKAFKKDAQDAIKIQDELTNKSKTNSRERSQQEKKEAQQRKKDAQDFQKQTKQSTDGVRKFRNQLLGVAAIFAGGMSLAKFASSTILTSANVGRLSDDIGETTVNLRAFQLAAESIGGSSEGMSQAFVKANQTIGALKTGIGDFSEYTGFLNMGGSASKDILKNPTSFILAQADLLKRISDAKGTAVAFQQAQQWLGMSQGEFDLLKHGSAFVRARVNEQMPLANAQARMQNQAERLQARMTALKGQFQAVGTSIMIDLMPVFDKLLAAFKHIGNWINAHQKDISRWIDSVSTSAVEFANAADKAAQAVGGWKVVLEGLLAIKAASIIAKFMGIASAIRGIGTAASGSGAILGRLGLIGAAGAAGYGIGSYINKHALEGTSAGNGIGEFVAWIMAGLGSKTAQDATGHTPFVSSGANWRQKQAAAFRQSMGFGPSASRLPLMGQSHTSSSETTIGEINIHTQATDADGIAKAIRPAINRHVFATQVNTGVK